MEVSAIEEAAAGESMLGLMRELYPHCRSLTGPGLRATIARIGQSIPLDVTEVPTGTTVFDWTIPPEWSIEDGYIEDERGARLVDFRRSNLHVMAYSIPVDRWLTLEELRPHLHSLPAHPDWVPFSSSYYREDWGFCLADRLLQTLRPGRYHAVIRSRLAPGAMTLAQHVHSGRSRDEVLVFAHTCHPSLCNDNLSGISVATHLASYLQSRDTRFTYRFVFAPATIGSIAWMSLNRDRLDRVRHGIVLAMLGDASPIRYKASRGGRHAIDRAARLVLRDYYPAGSEVPYSPWGFDERQFASPGIDLPVGRLTRALPGELPEEHTSADDFSLVSASGLQQSWRACIHILDVLERNRCYRNLQPCGEPQLGRRGLFRSTGGYYDSVPERQLALLWILNQSDGATTLIDIAERAGLPFDLLAHAASDLQVAGLLEQTDG